MSVAEQVRAWLDADPARLDLTSGKAADLMEFDGSREAKMRAFQRTKRNDPGRKIDAAEDAARRVRERRYLNELRKAQRAGAWFEQFARDWAAQVPRRAISVEPFPARRKGSAHWILHLSDWHIGVDTAHAEDWVREFEARWRDRMRWDTRGVETLLIVNTGDLFDGWGMHPDQHSHQDLSGFEQVTRASDLFAWLVASVAETVACEVEVHCTPGNHDRATADRKADPDRKIGRLAFHYAERMAGVGRWHIHPGGKHVGVRRFGDGAIKMCHGDEVKIGNKIRNVAWAHDDRTTAWELWLSGHLHEPMVQTDKHVMHVRGGTLKRGLADGFAQSIGYDARASQTMIEIDPETGGNAVHVVRF